MCRKIIVVENDVYFSHSHLNKVFSAAIHALVILNITPK